MSQNKIQIKRLRVPVPESDILIHVLIVGRSQVGRLQHQLFTARDVTRVARLLLLASAPINNYYYYDLF
jgi:hypothetical protein